MVATDLINQGNFQTAIFPGKETDAPREHRRLTQEQLVSNYRWDESLIRPDVFVPKFEEYFEKNPEIAKLIDKDKLYSIIQKSFAFADEAFADMIGSVEGFPMNYHNNIHAKITCLVNLEAMLGMVAIMNNGKDGLPALLKVDGVLDQYLATSTLSAAGHELRDWWDEDAKKDLAGNPVTVDQSFRQEALARQVTNLQSLLEENHLSVHDYNIFDMSDSFSEPPDKVVEKTTAILSFCRINGLNLTQFWQVVTSESFGTSDYKEKENIQRFLVDKKNEPIDPKKVFQEPIIDDSVHTASSVIEKTISLNGTEAGINLVKNHTYSINFADFAQAYNTNYLETIDMVDDNYNFICEVSAGPASLFLGDMSMWKDVPFYSYATTTDQRTGETKIDPKQLTIGQGFWSYVASPHLQPGMAAMGHFNEAEGVEIFRRHHIISALVVERANQAS